MATLRYDIDVDTARAERRIGAFALEMRSAITRAVKSLPAIEIDANSSQAQREVARIRAELVALGNKRIGVDIDAGAASARLAELRRELASLSNSDLDVQLDVDVAAGLAALAAVDKAVDKVDGRTAKVDVNVGSGLGDAIVKVGGLARGLQVLALPAAALAIAPALASIGSAAVTAAGGIWLLPAAATAAGIALATLKVGTAGIGAAFKAMSTAEDAAAANSVKAGAARSASMERIQSAQQNLARAEESAADRIRSAQDGVAKAQASVAKAQASAAEARENALSRLKAAEAGVADAVRSAAVKVQSAEDALANAQRRAQSAQEALTRARADAREELEDLKLSLSGAALSEEAAEIALERAQQRLMEARATGTSGLDLREADLAVRQAAQSLDEVRERYGDLKEEASAANESGVDGSRKVRAAQADLADANRGVADASRDLNRAQEDGARDVAKAQGAVAEAQRDVVKAQTEGAAKVAEAQANVADAQRDLAKAQTDGARQVADAQRDVAKAVAAAAESSVSGVDKVGAAMAKLAPNARSFVDAIKAIQPAFKDMQLDVQNRLFAGMADRVTQLGGTYLPILRTTLGGVADAFNTAGTRLSAFLMQSETVTTLRTAFGQLQGAVSDVISRSVEPLGRVFVDVLAVGAKVVADLAGGIGNAAERFAVFVHNARQTGQLETWIRNAVDVFKLLGQITANVGSALVSIFRAADSDGKTFLQTVADATAKVAAFLNSAKGESSVATVFNAIRTVMSGLAEALVNLGQIVGAAVSPMLDRLGTAFTALAGSAHPMLDALGGMGPVLAAVAEAITVLIEAAVPFAQAFGGTLAGALQIVLPALHLVADIVTAMAPVLQVIAPIIGTVTAAFLVWKTAMTGIAAAQAGLATLGTKLTTVAAGAGLVTDKFTGSAAAAERVYNAGKSVESALSKVGAALPIIGIGLIGLSAAYDAVKSKADDFATSVLNGSKTFQTAVNDERNQLEKNTLAYAPWLTAQESSERVARADADARKNVTAAMEAQLAGMGPLEGAQARAALAQGRWSDAVRDFGANSPQAIAAAGELAAATDRVEQEQANAATATKTHTDKMVEQAGLAAGFANADIAYEQSISRVAQAQKDAAAAARDHGAASKEAHDAHLTLVSANLAAADAAKRKAEEEAKAAGITDASKIGAQAYRDELFKLADQAAGAGDTSTANRLRGYAQATSSSTSATTLGEGAAKLFKDELTRLSENVSGPVQAALITARTRIDEASTSTVSGEEKTRLYKDELLRAADQAANSGDQSTAGALRQMAAQLDTTSARTNNTETQTGLFRTELIRNADYQKGPLREAYLETVAKLDGVSASNMTAEQKTDAFKQEIQRLRDRSGGVLRPELEELARRVTTMPDGTFKVTGVGQATWTDGSGTGWTINPNGTTSSRVGGLARGGMAGSVLPGYTPGHDVHQFYSPTAGRIALSGGEGILRPEATRALGGERGLREINREARKGGISGVHRFMTGGQIQKFREGGMFQAGVVPYPGMASGLHGVLKTTIAQTMAPVILQAIQMGGGNVLEWVKTQVGKPYLWGGVGPAGYDCSGLVSAAINVMRGQNPHRRLGSTGSMPWAGMKPGAAPMGGGVSVGSFKGNPGHMAATVNGVNIESWGGGGVRMGAGARGAGDGMFRERYYMPGNTAAGPGSGALEGGVGGGVTRWSGVVAQALSRLGQSQALVGTVLARMQKESGGNPGAINNWDSNAARGTPSKGLMQVIDPTFAAYRDPGLVNNIWDPLANISASMRYALARYGSLSAAYNRAGGYDLGGIADGSGLMRKSVLAPERVLSPRQTVAFDRLVEAVSMPSAGLGMGSEAVTVIATAAVRAALAQAAADGAARPQTVVQWQAREPLGHADLSYVANETARLQSWSRRRSG